MKRKLSLYLAGLIIGAGGLNGCAIALISAGAAGGYAISKDSVENYFDASQQRVFQKALAVAEEMGLVKLQDKENGIIKATIQEANITITIDQITKKSIKLKVKARNKFYLPKVNIAQEVYSGIVDRL